MAEDRQINPLAVKFKIRPPPQLWLLNGCARKKSGFCYVAHFVAVLLDKGVEVRHVPFASATQEDCWSLVFISFIGDFTRTRMKTAYLGERLHISHTEMSYTWNHSQILCMMMPVCYWPLSNACTAVNRSCLLKFSCAPLVSYALRLVFGTCSHTDLLGG